MKRDVTLYLKDIIESIDYIEKYLQNTTKETFETDVQLQDSVVRRLEIIGEAVKNIPHDLKDKYPNIPWKDAAATRDVFTHHYFGIILERVWKTAVTDLPPFKKQIKKLLKEF